VWQTKEGVEGQYMIVLLYRDCLVLATAGRNDPGYAIKAMISLFNVRVEEADNGKSNPRFGSVSTNSKH
jgi:hypothetical protein